MISPVVLIVEDEPLLRMLAVEAFTEHDFAVLEAEHAAEALAIHEAKGPIDLLFTDVNMPGEYDGIVLAETLKRRVPALHVFIASALPIQRPIDHIPATFFAKPYQLHAICGAASKLLAA